MGAAIVPLGASNSDAGHFLEYAHQWAVTDSDSDYSNINNNKSAMDCALTVSRTLPHFAATSTLAPHKSHSAKCD